MLSGHEVVSLLPPSMVDIPAELRDERGRFVFDDPVAERFATRAGLAREDSLVARLAQVGGRRATEVDAATALEGRGLGEDQHRAVGHVEVELHGDHAREEALPGDFCDVTRGYEIRHERAGGGDLAVMRA